MIITTLHSNDHNCMYMHPYWGSVLIFTDVDECAMGTATCHVRATCSDIVGGEDSYNCTCNSGYIGDGFSCISKLHYSFCDLYVWVVTPIILHLVSTGTNMWMVH